MAEKPDTGQEQTHRQELGQAPPLRFPENSSALCTPRGPHPVQCTFCAPTPTILAGSEVFTWRREAREVGKSLIHPSISQASFPPSLPWDTDETMRGTYQHG